MPRTKRVSLGGYVYHVLNRANGRLKIFRKDGDFEALEEIIAQGLTRFEMRICGYCIMSNHWHLLLWPHDDGVLSDFMRWITLTHTQRYHTAHGTVGMGHLYQGRSKSFPVQDESYSHACDDVRMAVATILLEHLLEHHFDMIFPRVVKATQKNEYFADTYCSCWKFGQSELPINSKRFDGLKSNLRH